MEDFSSPLFTTISFSPITPHLALIDQQQQQLHLQSHHLQGPLVFNNNPIHLQSSKQNANSQSLNNTSNMISIPLEDQYFDGYSHQMNELSDSRIPQFNPNPIWRQEHLTQREIHPQDQLFYRAVDDHSNDPPLKSIVLEDKQTLSGKSRNNKTQQQQNGATQELEQQQQQFAESTCRDDPNAGNNLEHIKHGIMKNTYMSKINQLVPDSEQLKRESLFIQKLQKEQQFTEEILRDQRMQESQRNRLNTTASAAALSTTLRLRSDSSSSEGQENVNNTGPGKPRAQLKQVRNRESARNSRKRKKIYVELLEQKVAHLTAELEKTKQALDTKNQFLRSRGSHTKLISLFLNQYSIIHHFTHSAEMLEKLEKCIQRNGEETEINLLLDSLRFRMGASGKERNQVIELFFKQIIDICIPAHFRYLLYTADLDPFSEQDTVHRDEWRKQLIESLGLKENQWNRITKFKKRFQQEKQNIDKLIVELKQVKNSIQQKTILLENMVDNLRNYMDPIQSAKFLAQVERNRYSKEVSNLRLWQALKSVEFEDDDDDEEIKEIPSTKTQIQPLQSQLSQQIQLQQHSSQSQLIQQQPNQNHQTNRPLVQEDKQQQSLISTQPLPYQQQQQPQQTHHHQYQQQQQQSQTSVSLNSINQQPTMISSNHPSSQSPSESLSSSGHSDKSQKRVSMSSSHPTQNINQNSNPNLNPSSSAPVTGNIMNSLNNKNYPSSTSPNHNHSQTIQSSQAYQLGQQSTSQTNIYQKPTILESQQQQQQQQQQFSWNLQSIQNNQNTALTNMSQTSPEQQQPWVEQSQKRKNQHLPDQTQKKLKKNN